MQDLLTDGFLDQFRVLFVANSMGLAGNPEGRTTALATVENALLAMLLEVYYGTGGRNTAKPGGPQ
jgi:hypothetical protein